MTWRSEVFKLVLVAVIGADSIGAAELLLATSVSSDKIAISTKIGKE